MGNEPVVEMPRYQSHKVVHALMIKFITETDSGHIYLLPVVYEDGYASWFSTKAFEDGYTRI